MANCTSPTICRIAALAVVMLASETFTMAAEPIGLHPDNPHYLLFRGQPTVLIGSTEHYGAVLNADFDYDRYLAALKSVGLNVTRTFSGVYCESPEAFGIRKNTLAPSPGKLLCPWARSKKPGYANGGAKFDLTRWNPAYFKRLKDFVEKASKRGVVVEYVLFCPFYKDAMWDLSPMKGSNNVNGIGERLGRKDVYTLKDPKLQAAQDAMVRKVVSELKGFDNLYYEICNEPYFGGVTAAWQAHIASVIADTEKDLGLPRPHLIAQNIANGAKKVTRPDRNVSIFNFHYATVPTTVGMNWKLNRPIADDETGFKGQTAAVYRMEAWEFLLAGGAIYDNLDYTFLVGAEDGSGKNRAPGCCQRALHKQLAILGRFLRTFDFVRMAPAPKAVRSKLPKDVRVTVLAEPAKAYAIYVRGDGLGKLSVDLPAGEYGLRWLNTRTGRWIGRAVKLKRPGGELTVDVPAYEDDVAGRIVRQP